MLRAFLLVLDALQGGGLLSTAQAAYKHESDPSLDTFFPRSPHANSLLHAPMASHFLTDQSFARQQTLLEDADGKAKVVYRGESDPKTRRMGFSLVKLNEDGIGEDGTALTEEEIFGAVLPIIPVSVRCTSPLVVEYRS